MTCFYDSASIRSDYDCHTRDLWRVLHPPTRQDSAPSTPDSQSSGMEFFTIVLPDIYDSNSPGLNPVDGPKFEKKCGTYTVSQKTCDYTFYNNFNNKCPITIIFGIVSGKSMCHRKMISFPTSPI